MASHYLKFNLNDIKNLSCLFSLINVFQFSARAFVLIFIPVMTYFTEKVKNIDLD
jgi:hypothetical protein